MNSIAMAELRMLFRNKLVAASAILIPLGLGAVFILSGGGPTGLSFTSTMQLLVMTAMGVYVTATTTLAARRQTLFLKRLRSGAVTDVSIIAGLVVPIMAISIVQVAIVFAALAFAADVVPQHPWLLVVAVLAAVVMFTGFALATAGVTNSPEHAQVTTLPIFFLVLGAAFWIMLTGTEELGFVKRSLPGGSFPALMELAWDGGDVSQVMWLLLPTIAWAAIALVAARVMFRWEPRA